MIYSINNSEVVGMNLTGMYITVKKKKMCPILESSVYKWQFLILHWSNDSRFLSLSFLRRLMEMLLFLWCFCHNSHSIITPEKVIKKKRLSDALTTLVQNSCESPVEPD